MTADLFVRSEREALLETPLRFGNRAWVEAGAGVASWIFLVLLAIHAASLLLLARQRGGELTAFQILGWAVAACATPSAFPAIAARLPASMVDVMAAIALPLLPVVSVVALPRALSTIRNRVSNVFTKLQVTDRSQAIVKARESVLGSDADRSAQKT